MVQCGGGPDLARLLQRTETLMAMEPYVPFFIAGRTHVNMLMR